MTSSDRKRKAQETRWAYSKKLAQRKANKESLPLIIEGLIDDELLPKSDQDKSLTVKIPAWGNLPPPGQTDRVILEWARDNAGFVVLLDQPFTGPLNPGDFPVPVLISPELLREGKYELRYRVSLWTGAEEEASAPRKLIIDKTPPYRTDYPAELITPVGPITDDFLSQNPTGMVCEIPDYPDKQDPGDVVAVFWVKNEIPEDFSDLTPIDGVKPVPSDRKVTIPENVIQQAGDGDFLAVYVLFDRTGNPSRISGIQTPPIQVALGLLPIVPLAAPTVPLAIPDGLIDRRDASAGVRVHVENYTNWKFGDKVEVTWGTQVLTKYPVTGSLLDISVPWIILKGQYDFTGAAEQSTNVSYRVLRGSVPFAAVPISVNVDLSVVGPDNPDEPGPINQTLGLVEVRGDSGLLNELTLADAGRDARAKLTLYDSVAPGNEILLHWNGIALDRPFIITNEQAGDEILILVPWDVISRGGSSNTEGLPVYYTVSGENANNDQESPRTMVVVDVVAVELTAPTFRDLNALGNLTCQSLYGPLHGVRVHIPPDSEYLRRGTVVTAEWLAYQGYDETTATPIESTLKTEQLPAMTAEQAVNGIDWLVEPYDVHVLPTYAGPADPAGRGRIRYSVDIKGKSVWSRETNAMVAMYTANDTCQI